MNKRHISIQHIQQDLKMISSLLRRKSLESIFVDIYSTDPIVLKSSKDRMEDMLKSDKETIVHRVETPYELDRFVNGNYDQNDVLIDEQLTNFAVFDSMSAEMIQISRYPFLLEWHRTLKGLVINPLTLALISRWRLFLNLVLLFISLYMFKIIPDNSMVQYFLGSSSPLYYGIWIPYLVLLLFDAKYLSRLYLLISEMSRRSKAESTKQKKLYC